MTLLSTLRKMILGETWELPVGVAVSLGATWLLAEQGAGGAAGLVLIILVSIVLVLTVNRTARTRR